MPKRIWMALLCLGLVAASAAFVACGDDDDGGSAEDKQEIVDTTTQLATTDGSEFTQEQQDFYLAHITDDFLKEFGTPDLAACEADFATCAGDPLPNPTLTADDVDIDGKKATVTLATEIGPIGLNMTKTDDVWKASGIFVPNDDIPDGTDVVDIDMKEFAFEGDLESDALKSGDFAIHAKNTGEQQHEMVLVPLGDDDRPLDEILQDQDFNPDPIFVKFAYGPDEESDIALPQKLDAGRYALVCFLPDTSEDAPPDEQTPHAFKGMTAEFTVE